MRDGAKQIVQAAAEIARTPDRLDGEGLGEQLAWQRLGRSAHQERVAEPFVQQGFEAFALHGVFAASVERFATAGQLAHEGVEKHIARSSLEANNLRQTAIRWQVNDARQTTQMQERSILRGMTKEEK